MQSKQSNTTTVNMKTVVIGAIDLGKTTANMIEQNKGVEVNPAFTPPPTMITATPTLVGEHAWKVVEASYTKPTNQKKHRKKNNRKKSKRRK